MTGLTTGVIVFAQKPDSCMTLSCLMTGKTGQIIPLSPLPMTYTARLIPAGIMVPTELTEMIILKPLVRHISVFMLIIRGMAVKVPLRLAKEEPSLWKKFSADHPGLFFHMFCRVLHRDWIINLLPL